MRFICLVLLLVPCGQHLSAQLSEVLYTTDNKIDTLNKGRLSLEIDNLSFYDNNEFGTTVQKGYTLPGFWFQPKLVYYPLSSLKIEAGVHSVWFWGTMRYPAYAYKNIPRGGGRDSSNIVHVLPYLRAHLALSDNVSIVLGSIYGGSNHRLIEPLYNPELNLTSDPEAGLQLLYRTKWLDLDLWIDWMTFIFEQDTHQEAFASGMSARFNANSPESRFHVYFPLQTLTQHNGGEINMIKDKPVQTVMNMAAGVGLKWNMNRRVLKYINAELDVAGYKRPKGEDFHLKEGRGYYAKLATQLKNFNIRASYWYCKDFVSMFGNPFYGAVSTKINNMYYDRPQMLYFGADYVRDLGKGFSFGINAEAYYYISGKMYSLETGLNQPSAFGNNTNYSMGVYMRINPSFLIKQY